ncbi:MAG: hypothetical protein ACE5K4_10145 [Candidatus Hydrothermarchaeota archaeon]
MMAKNKERGRIRERIIRTLLNNPKGNLTKYMISKEANSSYSWTHEFLEKLTEKGLLEGTKVNDYRNLMKFWQSVRIKPLKRAYMIKSPLELLKRSKLEYALTTYQAENLVQNYLFPSRIDFYIRENDFDKWHSLLSREGLVGEGNLRILIYDEHVFYKNFEKNGLKVVSLPQLILDLLEEGGVCVEAGEMLLEKVVRGAI